MLKPQIGDEVIVYEPSNSTHGKAKITEATLAKVGRFYVYTDEPGYLHQYAIKTGLATGGYRKRQLFFSKEAFDEFEKRNSLTCQIQHRLRDAHFWLNKLSLKQLESLLEILPKEES